MTKQLSAEEEIETQIEQWSDQYEDFKEQYEDLCCEISYIYESYQAIEDAYYRLPEEFIDSPRGKKLEQKIQEHEKEYNAIGDIQQVLA